MTIVLLHLKDPCSPCSTFAYPVWETLYSIYSMAAFPKVRSAEPPGFHGQI